jgi:hypothetical protein
MENFNKRKILQNIKENLFPEVNPYQLLLRLLFIHVLATAFVMAICPQFGLGLFSNGHYGLTGLFMKVSHEFCQMACGAFLTFTSGLSIWLSLKITEREWLFQHKFISIGLLLSLTSAFFWMQAPDVHLLEMALWICGSIIAITALTLPRADYSAS